MLGRVLPVNCRIQNESGLRAAFFKLSVKGFPSSAPSGHLLPLAGEGIGSLRLKVRELLQVYERLKVNEQQQSRSQAMTAIPSPVYGRRCPEGG